MYYKRIKFMHNTIYKKGQEEGEWVTFDHLLVNIKYFWLEHGRSKIVYKKLGNTRYAYQPMKGL